LEQSRRQTKEYKDEKALRHFDVLINSTGTGTLGRVAQCWFAPEKTTFDSHVTVARANDGVEPLWFGYALMELETAFEGMGEGATNQKELSKSRIADVLLKVPPKNLQILFSEFAANCATQIQVLAGQNQKLAQARDLLLPRLMNGEIAV
jgi:type I restriction enzyme S subunit